MTQETSGGNQMRERFALLAVVVVVVAACYGFPQTAAANVTFSDAAPAAGNA